MKRRQFLASAAILSPPFLRGSGDELNQTPLFISGQDGYHTYRIPALIVTAEGTLLAFAEGRRDNGKDQGDIDLLVKRSTDSGRTWSAQRIVYEEGGTAKITFGNPCPVVDRSTGTLWLPFCRDNDDIFITSSTDDGFTWSQPAVMTRSVKKPRWTWYATGPGVGIQLQKGAHKGRLVIPCDHDEDVDGTETRFSHVFFSDDHGRRWQLGGVSDPWTNECQVAELTDGTLMLNMRNHLASKGGQPEMGGRRATAFSKDGGVTWSPRRLDDTLIEPICQAGLVVYSAAPHEKNRLLFTNPASSSRRVRMTVRLSYDEGKTWPVAKVLHEGPAAYSSLCRLSDDHIGCLYECGESRYAEAITFARFSLSWLTDDQDRP